MLMDVGQQMEAIPLLLSGAIKIMRLDQDGDEILLYFLSLETAVRCPWARTWGRAEQHPRRHRARNSC